MNQADRARKWFLHTALAFLGTPYVWGGDDPSGFDCSGFVLECLKTAGLASEHEDFTADALLRRFAFARIDAPRPGALLFTLNVQGRATHVAICLDEHFQIGAAGGSRQTNSPRNAWRDNAYVRIRPIRFRPEQMVIVDPFAT